MWNTGDRMALGTVLLGIATVLFSAAQCSWWFLIPLILGVTWIVTGSLNLRRRLNRHKVS
jgi:hypothetical protein